MTSPAIRTFVLALGVVLASVSSMASAQVELLPQEPIHFLSGNTMVGHILSDDGSSIRLKTKDGLEMKVVYADLAPRTVYRLMLAKTTTDDAKGQLAIGDYAATHGLWANAQRHYNYAVKADPSLKADLEGRLDRLHAAASAALVAEAKKDLTMHHVKDAKHALSTVLHQFPDQEAAGEAGTMLTQITDQEKAEHDKEMEAKHSEETKHALASVNKKYKVVLDKIHDGLQNSDHQSTAISDFKHAIKECGLCTKDLAKLQKQHQDNFQLLDAAASLQDKVDEQSLSATTNLANAYMMRESYNEAMNVVNKALADDPKNQQLLNLRAQIASNSSNSGVYWGRRGGAVRRR